MATTAFTSKREVETELRRLGAVKFDRHVWKLNGRTLTVLGAKNSWTYAYSR